MDEPEKFLQFVLQPVGEFLSELSLRRVATFIAITCILTRVISGITAYLTRRPPGEEPWSARGIPYWIPYIGHGLSLGLRRQQLLENTRKGVNEPVFSFKVLGRRHNIITSRSMAETLLHEKNEQSTSSQAYLDYVMENVFGASRKMRKYNRANFHTVSGSINLITQEPHVTTLSSSVVREIRESIPNLVTFLPSFVDQHPWERVSAISVSSQSGTPSCDVNFYALIRQYVGSIVTTVLMGRAFTDEFPNVVPDMWMFNSRFNAMLMGISRFFPAPGLVPAYSARRRLVQHLTVFHSAFAAAEAGKDTGSGLSDLEDVSDFMQARSRAWINSGVPAGSAAREDLYVLWATNIKLATLVFWNLVHILADDDLHAQLLKEIAPYVRASRSDTRETGFLIQEPPRLSMNLEGLLKSCPLFKATFYETLRLHTCSFTCKKLANKVTLIESEEDANLAKRNRHPYQFNAGEYVDVPQSIQNRDARYFANPEEFDPRRYLRDTTSELSSIPREQEGVPESGSGQLPMPELESILPFSGQNPKGEGHEFAERTVMAFCAAVLVMWDIEPADSGPWDVPKRKPGSLVFDPDKEVRVKIKSRV